jgi:hypothetical protein
MILGYLWMFLNFQIRLVGCQDALPLPCHFMILSMVPGSSLNFESFLAFCATSCHWMSGQGMERHKWILSLGFGCFGFLLAMSFAKGEKR